MTVTQVKNLNKQKSKVFLDEEFAFVLYKGELRHYGIKENAEITEEQYQEIMEKILPKRAKLRCMNLLKSRSYTTEQLRRKLSEGYYPAHCIEEALSYVASYGYVNDEQYAADYISYRLESKSRKKLEMELIQKGIHKEMIAAVFDRLQEEGMESNEEQMIREYLQKKKFTKQNADEKEKNRILGQLFRRGFSLDNIYKVMNEKE